MANTEPYTKRKASELLAALALAGATIDRHAYPYAPDRPNVYIDGVPDSRSTVGDERVRAIVTLCFGFDPVDARSARLDLLGIPAGVFDAHLIDDLPR